MSEQLNLFDFQVEEETKVEPKFRLTPRQWALYRLIKKNTDEGRKTTQREIFEEIPGYEWHRKEFGAHDHCPMVWNDIEGEKGLNYSPEIQKTIIIKDFEYWIGNKEEIAEYLNAKWRRLSPALTRYWDLIKKVAQDGQCQIFSCQGELIDEDGRARGYIEAYATHGKF